MIYKECEDDKIGPDRLKRDRAIGTDRLAIQYIKRQHFESTNTLFTFSPCSKYQYSHCDLALLICIGYLPSCENLLLIKKLLCAKARRLLPVSGIKSEILLHLWTGNDLLNMELHISMMA